MGKPILKWAGGKRQLLSELKARRPPSYRAYHEPFFGGGALFFELEPDEGTINDANERLVNFYEQVQDNPDELVEVLRTFKEPESSPDPNKEFAEEARSGKTIEQYYYQQRELYNRRPNGEDFDPLEEAALLLYLNRTCYNGLYRENSDGEYNVPIGRYDNPEWVLPEQINKASSVLQSIEIHQGDFEYVLNIAESNDLVYFDPPYTPLSPTADFTEYYADGFDKESQTRLQEVAKELSDNGVHVILSNSAVMYDRYIECGFDVTAVGATRAINSDPDNRDGVDEIIATNVPPENRIQSRLTKF